MQIDKDLLLKELYEEKNKYLNRSKSTFSKNQDSLNYETLLQLCIMIDKHFPAEYFPLSDYLFNMLSSCSRSFLNSIQTNYFDLKYIAKNNIKSYMKVFPTPELFYDASFKPIKENDGIDILCDYFDERDSKFTNYILKMFQEKRVGYLHNKSISGSAFAIYTSNSKNYIVYSPNNIKGDQMNLTTLQYLAHEFGHIYESYVFGRVVGYNNRDILNKGHVLNIEYTSKCIEKNFTDYLADNKILFPACTYLYDEYYEILRECLLALNIIFNIDDESIDIDIKNNYSIQISSQSLLETVNKFKTSPYYDLYVASSQLDLSLRDNLIYSLGSLYANSLSDFITNDPKEGMRKLRENIISLRNKSAFDMLGNTGEDYENIFNGVALKKSLIRDFER